MAQRDLQQYSVPTHNSYGDSYMEPIQMEKDGCGDWVKYSDYELMWDDYYDMKLKYESLVRELGELYRDA